MVKIYIPIREKISLTSTPMTTNKNDHSSKPLIIGHRGASSLVPENTIAAFRRAIEDGADGIEMDVRLAADGVPVVFHDAGLKRTAGLKCSISDLASGDLTKIDVGSWFRQSKKEEKKADPAELRIATLDAALSFLRSFSGIIYIELKCRDNEIEKLSTAVARSIRDSGLIDRIIVKSFKLAVLPLIKRDCPTVRTAALFAPKIMSILRKEKYLVKIAAEMGADEISLHYTLATKKLVSKAEKRGLPVAIWTADSPRWVKRAIKLGIKTIITNDPSRLIARRKELVG